MMGRKQLTVVARLGHRDNNDDEETKSARAQQRHCLY